MKLTSKGRVTIPVEVRQQLGLRPGDEIDFIVEEGACRVVAWPSRTTDRGEIARTC